ncbi:hypothetical protein YB2330_000841 [Saitoella coloradoensis]
MSSGFKKLTVQPKGVWARIWNFFSIDPNRSTGIPLNPTYRMPAPGSRPERFQEPVTAPASDIAENQYFNRDVRRQYPRSAVTDQSTLAGLLTLGSAEAPRTELIGESGAKDLVAAQEKSLAEVVQERGAAVLEKYQGFAPLPGTGKGGHHWTLNKSEGFDTNKYPVRMFN